MPTETTTLTEEQQQFATNILLINDSYKPKKSCTPPFGYVIDVAKSITLDNGLAINVYRNTAYRSTEFPNIQPVGWGKELSA